MLAVRQAASQNGFAIAKNAAASPRRITPPHRRRPYSGLRLATPISPPKPNHINNFPITQPGKPSFNFTINPNPLINAIIKAIAHVKPPNFLSDFSSRFSCPLNIRPPNDKKTARTAAM